MSTKTPVAACHPILKPLGQMLAVEERAAETMAQVQPVEVVCSWCQKLYGVPPVRPNQTHGICMEHKAAMLADLEQLQYIKR